MNHLKTRRVCGGVSGKRGKHIYPKLLLRGKLLENIGIFPGDKVELETLKTGKILISKLKLDKGEKRE